MEVGLLEQYNCPRVFVIGLGPGRIGDMTVSALELMNGASCVLLRTSHHPTVNDLADKGISYETLDQLYEEGDDFEAVYRAIAVKVIDAARSAFEDDRAAYVVYAVPGSPYIGERSVQLLMEISERVGVSVSILPAVSFLDSVVCSAGIDPFDGLQVVDALSIDSVPLNTSVALVVPQVYSRMVASAVKSRLLQAYPDEHPVLLAKAVRTDSELVERMNLYEIDRDDRVDYLTTLVVPPLRPRVDIAGYERAAVAFSELVSVMAALRADDGCPWDREQTHESLKKYLVEETYEVLDTIDQQDKDKLCEELGDVMLQTVFHAEIAREDGYFDAADVASGIVDKLIRRHPHVFGSVEVDGTEEVLRNWERIKAAERGDEGRFSGVFDSVPVSLPALLRAHVVQSKASKVGFDWNDYRPALEKVDEEIAELKEVLDSWDACPAGESRAESVKEELGDVLFAIVNVARLLGIDPEDALRSTVAKFISRFKFIEERAASVGADVRDMTLEEMDKLWEESKRALPTDKGE